MDISVLLRGFKLHFSSHAVMIIIEIAASRRDCSSNSDLVFKVGLPLTKTGSMTLSHSLFTT